MPHTLHFAALSGKSMAKGAAALATELGQALPADAQGEGADGGEDGDSWAYISTALPDGTQLSLTRTEGFDTIATWVAGAPTGVNWQLMLTREAGLDTALVDRLCHALHQALGTRLAVYLAR